MGQQGRIHPLGVRQHGAGPDLLPLQIQIAQQVELEIPHRGVDQQIGVDVAPVGLGDEGPGLVPDAPVPGKGVDRIDVPLHRPVHTLQVLPHPLLLEPLHRRYLRQGDHDQQHQHRPHPDG
ncbi:hypothetical protein D3C80_1308120 [compost metagenome]